MEIANQRMQGGIATNSALKIKRVYYISANSTQSK
jgi:hypothetical protein